MTTNVGLLHHVRGLLFRQPGHVGRRQTRHAPRGQQDWSSRESPGQCRPAPRNSPLLGRRTKRAAHHPNGLRAGKIENVRQSTIGNRPATKGLLRHAPIWPRSWTDTEMTQTRSARAIVDCLSLPSTDRSIYSAGRVCCHSRQARTPAILDRRNGMGDEKSGANGLILGEKPVMASA
jgi:hypothetical protein